MELQDLAVYERSGDKGGRVNRSRYCSADPTGHLFHLVSEVFNVLSRFVCKPHFLQGLDKRANGRTVNLLLILDESEEELRTRGVTPEVFFDIPPDLERNGREHSLSAPRNIVAVEVEDREKIYFTVPNPCSFKGLDPLGDFSYLDAPQ